MDPVLNDPPILRSCDNRTVTHTHTYTWTAA